MISEIGQITNETNLTQLFLRTFLNITTTTWHPLRSKLFINLAAFHRIEFKSSQETILNTKHGPCSDIVSY